VKPAAVSLGESLALTSVCACVCWTEDNGKRKLPGVAVVSARKRSRGSGGVIKTRPTHKQIQIRKQMTEMRKQPSGEFVRHACYCTTAGERRSVRAERVVPAKKASVA
jgi:hypothetical protein